MKKQWLSISLMAFFTIFVLASCGKDEDAFQTRQMLKINHTDGYSDIDPVNCQYNLDNLPTSPLSTEESDNLLFMREEEKLAKDVNTYFFANFNHQIFQNIATSEATHTGAVLQLIDKYQLTDPVGANGAGVFTDTSLQKLYTALIAQGQTSLVEALKTGALVEEVDILDLQNALATFVDNKDIELVYKNLLAASYNHLKAFVNNLKNQGVTYVPQHLTQAQFDSIMQGDWNQGYHGG